MSRWNRPMRIYKSEPIEQSPWVPSVHPKVRARVLAAIAPGSACSMNDLRAYTGYQGLTLLRAINALEISGEIVGIYEPLPYRWTRSDALLEKERRDV